MAGPRSRGDVAAELERAAHELADTLARLAADIHGDGPGLRAVVRFDERLSDALELLTLELARPEPAPTSHPWEPSRLT